MARRIRHYSRFPRAIPEERARSHALLTRPPLTPKGPLDLHVLSLPPAFVLSQDQTLKLKGVLFVLPLRCLRTEIPKPDIAGRNPFFTSEPLHIAPAFRPEPKRHRSPCIRSHWKQTSDKR